MLKNLPQLNYILFEVIRIPINRKDDGTEELGAPEQDNVVMLDRVYTSIRYQHGVLSSTFRGFSEEVLQDKAGLKPVRIKMTGTFGHAALRRGRKLLTGFQRFKEFRDDLFNKVNSIKDSLIDKNLPTKKRYIYGLNFYDMIHHWWGRIDLQGFLPTSDARVSSIIPFYDIDCVGMGEIIDVNGRDMLVKLVKSAIKIAQLQELVEGEFIKWINEIPYIGEIYRAGDEILDIISDIEISIQFANQYLAQTNQMHNLYNQVQQGFISTAGQRIPNLESLKSYIPVI